MSEMMHHNNFSAADIEKYRKGQLTPAEMHALEKAALDDPFLADAMEGFGVPVREDTNRGGGKTQDMGRDSDRSDGKLEEDIKELRERLRKRVEEEKRSTIAFAGWWKIAAAIILIAGGIWTYRAMNSSTAVNNIAAKEVAKTSQPPTPAPADSVQATGNADTITDAAQLNTKNKKDSSTITRSGLISAPVTAAENFNNSFYNTTPPPAKKIATPTKSLAGDEVANKNLEDRTSGIIIKKDTLEWSKDMAFDKSRDKESPEAAARRETVMKNMLAKDSVHEYKVAIRGYLNSPLNSFNGRILDKLNKPVAGASIEIPGRQQSYATDSLGYFSFKAPDTALKVSIASVGYVQRYYTLRNSNSGGFNNNSVAMGNSNSNGIASNNTNFFSNQVVLQQVNPALNEVVVVGYGARKKELLSNRDQMKVTVLDAAPDTGWDDYNDYLEKNKKVPDGADDIHGSVVVRFNIDNNGTMKNFAIEKSLGDALDAEAIRLVKEGPSWHLLKGKGKKSKVTVMVRF